MDFYFVGARGEEGVHFVVFVVVVVAACAGLI